MSPSSPRLQRGPDPLSGILITTPPGDNHNNNKGLTHCYHGKKLIVTMITRLSGMGGPFCHKNWPYESMGQRGDLYGALHPLPSLFTSKEKQYMFCSRHVKLAGQWSCLLQPKEKNNMFELADATCIRFTKRARWANNVQVFKTALCLTLTVTVSCYHCSW